MQPPVDILRDLATAQRLKVKVCGHPLRKLNQWWGGKQILKLRLPYQYELQKLILIGIHVGQHPKRFKRVGLQILCFVDDQYGSSAMLVLGMQIISKSCEQYGICSFEGLTQRHQDPLQELIPAFGRIRD